MKNCGHSNIHEIEQHGISYRVCADCGCIHWNDIDRVKEEIRKLSELDQEVSK